MPRPDTIDPLWSLRRSAEFLDCSIDTLRRYAKTQGRIRFFQIGKCGRLKFRQSELEKFLAQNSRRTNAS
jgi:predicted site-specific integrase-resolvase